MKLLSIAELKALLKNKTYRKYDGWYSTSTCLEIKNIRHSISHKGWYDIIATTSSGEKKIVTVSDFAIHQLAKFGEHETVYEVEECVIRDKFQII